MSGAGEGTAIVFDFGGVLFRWQPKELLARVLPHHAPDDTAAQALVEQFFQSCQGDWGDFDRGTGPARAAGMPHTANGAPNGGLTAAP